MCVALRRVRGRVELAVEEDARAIRARRARPAPLEGMPAGGRRRTPSSGVAIRIVDRHLDLLAAHDFMRLQHELACEEPALQAATVLLRGLTPRPGASCGADETQFVVADVIVQHRTGAWVASINPEVIPRIHVSGFFAGILKGGRAGCSSSSTSSAATSRRPRARRARRLRCAR